MVAAHVGEVPASGAVEKGSSGGVGGAAHTCAAPVGAALTHFRATVVEQHWVRDHLEVWQRTPWARQADVNAAASGGAAG